MLRRRTFNEKRDSRKRSLQVRLGANTIQLRRQWYPLRMHRLKTVQRWERVRKNKRETWTRPNRKCERKLSQAKYVIQRQLWWGGSKDAISREQPLISHTRKPRARAPTYSVCVAAHHPDATRTPPGRHRPVREAASGGHQRECGIIVKQIVHVVAAFEMVISQAVLFSRRR